ncbi:ABC transporter, ATP-binding protein [Longispora fulva]|uniref:Putative ATPase n=1 Tax=Longispora fulva TaxID=619741 RepID=A0A8J7KJJ0_9ACTN|nr:AAA family ATPase [Longispora fulva]MBG6140460.1 putative ATPase [Longispora fulva]GIG57158.1 ABC transporter, ATP-binding protein [Longispora fulva]
MLIDSLDVDQGKVDLDRWPYTVPAVRQLTEEGLEFRRPITVLVGANGSGKSTVLEAIAERYGLDASGGHGGRARANVWGKSLLGDAMRLYRTREGKGFRGAGAKGFFLRAETAHEVLAWATGREIPGYGDSPSWEVSHGESYLQAITGRFSGAGLYLLDEAEGPLSFEATLQLLFRLVDLAAEGAQVIYSTHSPLVAALPGAQVLELGAHGIRDAAWEDLEMVGLWRRFLAAPGRFFTE